MPKGVEHSEDEEAIRDLRRGESSVMPKGVEHPEEINRDTVDEHAKFSDAERR